MYPVQEIPRMVADCNLGLVPLEISSITDYVLPLKLLEYTSMGIPSITVRNTTIGHYFGDDDCLFYESGNVQSLRTILDRLAANPEIFADISDALWRSVKSSSGAAKSRST